MMVRASLPTTGAIGQAVALLAAAVLLEKGEQPCVIHYSHCQQRC